MSTIMIKFHWKKTTQKNYFTQLYIPVHSIKHSLIWKNSATFKVIQLTINTMKSSILHENDTLKHTRILKFIPVSKVRGCNYE